MPSWNWQGIFWVGIVPPQQMATGKGTPENQYVPHVWVLSDGFPSKNVKIAVNAEHLSLWLRGYADYSCSELSKSWFQKKEETTFSSCEILALTNEVEGKRSI